MKRMPAVLLLISGCALSAAAPVKKENKNVFEAWRYARSSCCYCKSILGVMRMMDYAMTHIKE